MSKVIDYSKFDHIGDNDSDEEQESSTSKSSLQPKIKPNEINFPPPISPLPSSLMTKKGKEGRFKFEYDGNTIYEWEQSLEDVNIYIVPPTGITRHDLEIIISHSHLRIGLKGLPSFIDEDTCSVVVPDESTWTFSDNEVTIILQKMRKGEAWDCALKGKSGQKNR